MILVLSIFGAVLVVVFVLVLVYFRLKDDKVLQSTENRAPGQQQGDKNKVGPGGTAGAAGGSQDKKDNQGRPLITTGSIQEAEEGVQSGGSEYATNSMKAKNSISSDQKVTKVNNATSTAEPLKTDQTGSTTERGKENSEAGSSGKVGAEEKQLITESFEPEALNTLNSQQVDDLLAKSKVVTPITAAETLTLNSNVALLSLAKKVKEEYASDANAQAWMNSGFRMQAFDNYEKNKDFENLWISHLSLPKDDKKRATFKEILKLASDANRNRAGMYEVNGKYKECENNIVEATIAEYLQLKVMTDGESFLNRHQACMHFMKSIVTRTNSFGFNGLSVKNGAAVFEGFQIMKSIAREVIKHKEQHEYFLRCMKKNPCTLVEVGPDDLVS